MYTNRPGMLCIVLLGEIIPFIDLDYPIKLWDSEVLHSLAVYEKKSASLKITILLESCKWEGVEDRVKRKAGVGEEDFESF